MAKKGKNIKKYAMIGGVGLAGYFLYDYYRNNTAGSVDTEAAVELPSGDKVAKFDFFISTAQARYAGNQIVAPYLRKSNLEKLSQADFDFIFNTLMNNEAGNVGGNNYIKIQNLTKKYQIS